MQVFSKVGANLYFDLETVYNRLALYRGKGGEERDATRYRQGTGPPVEADRGGGGVGARVMEAVRVGKGTLDGRNLGSTRTWT